MGSIPTGGKRQAGRKTQHTTKVVCFTGVAQRQRAGLITPRSLDRDGSPVFFIFRVL